MKFTVTGSSISGYKSAYTIPSGSIGWLKAKFSFSDDWQNLAKTAVFMLEDETHYDAMIDAGGICVVPKEAAEKSGWLYVGVYGRSGDGIVATTTLYECRIVQGAPSSGASNTGQQTAKDESLYQQMQTLYAKIVERNDDRYTALEGRMSSLENNTTSQIGNLIFSVTASGMINIREMED